MHTETIALAVQPTKSWSFVGGIATSGETGIPEDGILQIAHGQVITATYYDIDNGSGSPADVNDIAIADCQGPVVSNIQVFLAGLEPQITFQTNEPAAVRVLCDLTCGEPYAIQEAISQLQTNHTVELSGVVPGTSYFYIVEATDAVGNMTVEDNGGSCYIFTTGDAFRVPSDYPTIQEAIDQASDGGIVLVADGVYTGPGNHDIELKGKNCSIYSENGPANCIIDCEGNAGFIFMAHYYENTILDGFTITNGNGYKYWADWGYEWHGGAIYCNVARLKIANCIITGNSVANEGGGIYCRNSYLSGGVRITNCMIIGNSAKYGGGIKFEGGSHVLTNCIISNNTSEKDGGGIHVALSSHSDCMLTMKNCLVAGNQVLGTNDNPAWPSEGGGLYCGTAGSAVVTGCTFAGNTAPRAGGVYYRGQDFMGISNCILWGNVPDGLYGPAEVTYSCLQQRWPTEGNIEANPLFADATNGNYRLSRCSPCIDTGTNSPPGGMPEYDLDGEDRVIDGNRDAIAMVDMGAYEFSCSVDPTVYVPADYPTIQAAIDEVCFGEMVIIVADGVYTGPGNRDLDFLGKAITVRSENGPENCIIDCEGTEGQPHRGFSFHNGEDNATVLEGFTITSGYGPDVTVPWGAASAGGAILCTNQSSPTIRNCVMTGNTVGDLGGAIFCQNDSSPALDHCLIVNNTASHGGAMYCYNGSSPEITHCTFSDNSVVTRGGAMRCLEDSSPIITNSIFWANEVADPCGGAELALRVNCNATVIYSDIAGGATAVLVENGSSLDWGIGNLSVDPCFVDPTGGDYHLQSQAGRWDPNNENWVQDGATSRAIDAGNPGCQLADEPQDANNVRINMGAYGGTAQASKTPTGWTLLGDINNDGIIDLQDHAIQATMWLITADAQPGDLDRNGIINIGDLCLLVEEWLNETTWCEY